MSNFLRNAPQWLQNGCPKKFQTFKVIYRFKARDLEIPLNTIFREIFKFRENTSKTDFPKFLKVFIKSRNLNISLK